MKHFKKSLLIGFVVLSPLAWSAGPVVQMDSIVKCVKEAYSSDGLDLSTDGAREFCQKPGVVRMTSIIQCVKEAYSTEGFDMSSNGAKEFCSR